MEEQDKNLLLQQGQPPLRVWDLRDNSTRYDKILAAPSDEALVHYWIAWSAILLVVAVATMLLFCGIVSSKKARRNPFNIYLVYLTIPDFLFSFLCSITCAMNAWNGEYWSGWMCSFQHWYVVFGIGSNAWLNAAVSRELYTMLKMSDNRRKYTSPTRKQVMKQAFCVYSYCSFLGCWGFLFDDAKFFPHRKGPTSGLACLPMEIDKPSTIFFWVVFFPMFVGIPVAYVCYVCYDVWFGSKLLPPIGRRRILVVYFFRLILVFMVMWLPTFIILFIAASWLPPWAHFAGWARR